MGRMIGDFWVLSLIRNLYGFWWIYATWFNIMDILGFRILENMGKGFLRIL